MYDLSLSCRLLRAVVLSGCNALTNFGLESLASNLQSIKLISLSGCTLIQDEAIKFLVEKQKFQLGTLNLCQTGLTDSGMEFIASNCAALQSLHVSFCDEITDDGLLHLTRLGHTLHILHISCCTRLTELAVIGLTANLPILTELNLNGVRSISSTCTYQLMRYNPCLIWLDLMNCPNLTIEQIMEVKKHYTSGGRKFQLLSSFMLA
jgi:hypothetical protein